ncbi:MAG: rhomboid family intramembrane serine protease [Planctomycetes bacterium]|nr:rhomboid family intramembrane serine protease [Planctomycetota bacterium]
MGIQSRDYIRESNTGSFSFGHSGGSLWAIKYLLIANIAVFAVDSLLEIHVNDWLSLKLNHRIVSTGADVYRGVPVDGSRLPEDSRPEIRLEAGTVVDVVKNGNSYLGIRWGEGPNDFGWIEPNAVRRNYLGLASFWRYLTYGFCHDRGSMWHIVFNMYFLWMFGRLVEPIYGSREFLAFYLTAIIVSGFCFLGVRGSSQIDVEMIGASGAVMAVVFLAAMHYPREKVYVMFVIPLEFRWLAVLYALGDTFGFVRGGGEIAHVAHLGGAAFGVAYKYFGWRMYGIWNRLRGGMRLPRLRSRPKVRLYKPSVSSSKTSRRDLDSQVDRILDKISKQGEASLTDDERNLLKKASQKYKKR